MQHARGSDAISRADGHGTAGIDLEIGVIGEQADRAIAGRRADKAGDAVIGALQVDRTARRGGQRVHAAELAAGLGDVAGGGSQGEILAVAGDHAAERQAAIGPDRRVVPDADLEQVGAAQHIDRAAALKIEILLGRGELAGARHRAARREDHAARRADRAVDRERIVGADTQPDFARAAADIAEIGDRVVRRRPDVDVLRRAGREAVGGEGGTALADRAVVDDQVERADGGARRLKLDAIGRVIGDVPARAPAERHVGKVGEPVAAGQDQVAARPHRASDEAGAAHHGRLVLQDRAARRDVDRLAADRRAGRLGEVATIGMERDRRAGDVPLHRQPGVGRDRGGAARRQGAEFEDAGAGAAEVDAAGCRGSEPGSVDVVAADDAAGIRRQVQRAAGAVKAADCGAEIDIAMVAQRQATEHGEVVDDVEVVGVAQRDVAAAVQRYAIGPEGGAVALADRAIGIELDRVAVDAASDLLDRAVPRGERADAAGPRLDGAAKREIAVHRQRDVATRLQVPERSVAAVGAEVDRAARGHVQTSGDQRVRARRCRIAPDGEAGGREGVHLEVEIARRVDRDVLAIGGNGREAGEAVGPVEGDLAKGVGDHAADQPVATGLADRAARGIEDDFIAEVVRAAVQAKLQIAGAVDREVTRDRIDIFERGAAIQVVGAATGQHGAAGTDDAAATGLADVQVDAAGRDDVAGNLRDAEAIVEADVATGGEAIHPVDCIRAAELHRTAGPGRERVGGDRADIAPEHPLGGKVDRAPGGVHVGADRDRAAGEHRDRGRGEIHEVAAGEIRAAIARNGGRIRRSVHDIVPGGEDDRAGLVERRGRRGQVAREQQAGHDAGLGDERGEHPVAARRAAEREGVGIAGAVRPAGHFEAEQVEIVRAGLAEADLVFGRRAIEHVAAVLRRDARSRLGGDHRRHQRDRAAMAGDLGTVLHHDAGAARSAGEAEAGRSAVEEAARAGVGGAVHRRGGDEQAAGADPGIGADHHAVRVVDPDIAAGRAAGADRAVEVAVDRARGRAVDAVEHDVVAIGEDEIGGVAAVYVEPAPVHHRARAVQRYRRGVGHRLVDHRGAAIAGRAGLDELRMRGRRPERGERERAEGRSGEEAAAAAGGGHEHIPQKIEAERLTRMRSAGLGALGATRSNGCAQARSSENHGPICARTP